MKILIVVLCNVTICLPVLAKFHPDIGLSFIQRVKRHGYPVTLHQVTTEDGYILCLYRIPYGIHESQSITKNKSAVLFLHGMGGSPNNWILLGPKDSSPYYFADRGFDVWIMACRGVETWLEKKHIKYDWLDDLEYWDYSLHDIGIYDLPAAIDYVIDYTKQEKIFFVGHSAACPQFFIMMSEKPQYNGKIKIGNIYGSSPILKDVDYPMVLFASTLVDLVKGVVKYLGMTEFFPQLRFLNDVSKLLCMTKTFLKACRLVIDAIGSSKSVLMDNELVPLIASESIGRLSSRQIIQYLDNVKIGEFRQFNYGAKINKEVYGDVMPPQYNLSNCKAPVAFFYGSKDSFCVKKDLYKAINQIPNVILDYEIPFAEYTHTDFIFGRNSTHLVYEPTCKLFKDYDEGKAPNRITKRDIVSL